MCVWKVSLCRGRCIPKTESIVINNISQPHLFVPHYFLLSCRGASQLFEELFCSLAEKKEGLKKSTNRKDSRLWGKAASLALRIAQTYAACVRSNQTFACTVCACVRVCSVEPCFRPQSLLIMRGLKPPPPRSTTIAVSNPPLG